MKDLSLKAQIYVAGTILVGLVVLALNLPPLDFQDGWMVLALAGVASLSLIFKVIGSTERSHYNISFLIYAFTFIMFGPEASIWVILLSNVVEWAWHRYAWYIQCFNISTYVIATYFGGVVYQWILLGDSLQSLTGVLAILSAMGAFTLLNHLLVGMALWLARGENLSKSGVFEFFPLMLDFTLLCMGAGTALVWMSTPYGIILALLPLYLIYSTLKVPALERKTEIDSKTGLFNAEFFNRSLQNELSRAHRFQRPLTIVMADLDLLRNINNTYGHLAGDEVLIGVANILKSSLRDYDVVARFGGEEYAVMMPETTPEEAYPRIEAIREIIESTDFVVPTSVTPIKATMSFGIAAREGSEQTVNEIIHNADTALYHAKLKGRNGVFIYANEGFVTLFDRIDYQTEHVKPSNQDAGSKSESKPFIHNIDQDQLFQAAKPQVEVVEEDETTQNTAKPRAHWVVTAYILGLATTALILFALFFQFPTKLDWIGLGFFALLVLLTELLSIDIYVRNNAVSTSAAPMLAGILLFGPIGAATLALIFSIVAMIKHKSPFSRFIFNASNQLIAGILCTAVVWIVGEAFIDLESWMQFVLSLIAAGIVYLSTTGLIAIGIGLDYDLTTQEVWIERFSWLAPYYFGMGLLAFALIYSYHIAAWSSPIIVLVPLLLLRLSQKQYIDRTKTVVNELRENNQILEQNTKEITKLNDALLETLSVVIDLRDPFVLGHSRQVTNYSVLVARRLGLAAEQIERIRKASLLHDIGKLGISDSILLKPGTLTKDEYDTVKQHSVLGANILESSHTLRNLIPIVRYHHERYDGKGYPDGLAGNDIPIEARIVALADAVEAMASDRPYRQGLSRDDILREIKKNSGTQFDPDVVNAFVEIVEGQGEPMIINLASRSIFGHP
ncbi:MAG TPA: diguanylate cyclase, partial [Anaerolineales bacterium]|nr:diguanylate cyclase [Anaerolineales bacterium]